MNSQPSTLGLVYGYNTVNNRLTRSETVGSSSTVTQTYGYDPIDQVTSVNYGTGRSETFAYDPVRNRTSATDSAAGTTIYTAINQYTAVDSLPVPAYDVNGNLTAFNGWTYSYDTENRLTGASKTGTSASFTYDWRRRQASRTINGTTKWFIYDGGNLVAEYSSAGILQANYVHGHVADEILTRMDGSGAVYYHNDALGSTVALTDSAGAVVERYTDVFECIDNARSLFEETVQHRRQQFDSGRITLTRLLEFGALAEKVRVEQVLNCQRRYNPGTFCMGCTP